MAVMNRWLDPGLVEVLGSDRHRGFAWDFFSFDGHSGPLVERKHWEIAALLGLPTVYGIVCQFGGQIVVESRSGEGSCFEIYFPVQHPAEQIEEQTRIFRETKVNKVVASLTVLLADDEPSLRGAVAEYLRGVGHVVLESQSAHEALELARSYAGTIDVLLTDVIMPGMRGTELAQEMRQVRPEVQVIFISGYAQTLPEAQIPRGATFLQKPFRLASLAEQLKLVPGKV